MVEVIDPHQFKVADTLNYFVGEDLRLKVFLRTSSSMERSIDCLDKSEDDILDFGLDDSATERSLR